MSLVGMATLTLVKVKQFTSIALVRLARGIAGTEFMKRSRKTLWGGLCLWVAAIGFGFFVYQSVVNRDRLEFYQTGVHATQKIAQESRSALLDKDVLTLNLAVRSIEQTPGLISATVVDHQGQSLARIGAEETGRHPLSFQDQAFANSLDGVGVSGVLGTGANRYVLFSQTITYSNVDIGRAVIALSAAGLSRDLERAQSVYFATVMGLGLVLAGFIVWSDRRKSRKSAELARHIESLDSLGPYRLLSKVAQGGMAELFLADYLREDGFRRRVALKRILPHLATNEEFIRMFVREARLAALLQHPNIVQVFDYGKISNVSFIAMEYIDGKSLGQVISQMKEGLPVEPAVFIFSEICKGLDYSHTKVDDQSGKALNIVHRDISPQNILISYQGEVKISDFGISKASTDPNLTQAGVIKGKLMYLAPEQLIGLDVDHRLDLYALGLVAYQTLTGHFAYQFDSEVEAIKNIPTAVIPPLSHRRPGIPEELERIVMKCLDKNVATRYQSAAAIGADLSAYKRKHHIAYDSADLAALLRGAFRPGAGA
jgi:tRNA A-37 threonylcarbamoyl transferase component Bud32